MSNGDGAREVVLGRQRDLRRTGQLGSVLTSPAFQSRPRTQRQANQHPIWGNERHLPSDAHHVTLIWSSLPWGEKGGVQSTPTLPDPKGGSSPWPCPAGPIPPDPSTSRNLPWTSRQPRAWKAVPSTHTLPLARLIRTGALSHPGNEDRVLQATGAGQGAFTS